MSNRYERQLPPAVSSPRPPALVLGGLPDASGSGENPRTPVSLKTHQQSALGLSAFVQLYERAYTGYARARLLDGPASEAAVAAAFGLIADRWAALLQCARPAGEAWLLLRMQIQIASREIDRPDSALCRLYAALPYEIADTAVLRWRLRMGAREIADLMGMDPSVVVAHQRTAQRQLPGRVLKRLEVQAPHS